MGAKVFNNEVLDEWLTKKAADILSKVDREKITTEEMLILVLKAQTNHFHHMDLEFRGEFKSVAEEFKTVREEFKLVREEIKEVRNELNKFKHEVWQVFKWQTGIFLTLFAGLYAKLFFG